MNRNTTCHNFECPHIETCTFNIWEAPESKGPCMDGKNDSGDYLSAKQAIYGDYIKKAAAQKEKPMSRTEYFEEW